MKKIKLLIEEYFQGEEKVNVIDIKEKDDRILFSIDYLGMMGIDGGLNYLGCRNKKRFFTLYKSNLFSFIKYLEY